MLPRNRTIQDIPMHRMLNEYPSLTDLFTCWLASLSKPTYPLSLSARSLPSFESEPFIFIEFSRYSQAYKLEIKSNERNESANQEDLAVQKKKKSTHVQVLRILYGHYFNAIVGRRHGLSRPVTALEHCTLFGNKIESA